MVTFAQKRCRMNKSPKFKKRRRLAAIFAASVLGATGLAIGNAVTTDSDDSRPKPHKPPATSPLPPQHGKPSKPNQGKPKPHPDKPPVPKKKPTPPKKSPVSGKDYYTALGSSESGNDYTRVNTIGCAGRWQFCPISIGGPGWGKYNGKRKKWLRDHAYQNEVMERYTKNHWDQIVDLGLTKYLCKKKTSTKGDRYQVTQGGMLAGAHLGGVWGLYNYLKKHRDVHDAYGTYISDYVSRYEDTYITNKWAAKKGNSLAGCRGPFKQAGKNKTKPAAKRHAQASSRKAQQP